MEIRKMKAESLKFAKYNPRKDLKSGDTEYEKLKKSIEEFGYVEPVIWNERTGNIVGGHQRLKVLVSLGVEEIDCVVVDMDEQKEKALNIALNKISGEWDMPMLTDLLKDLEESGFDVSFTGFDMAEIDELFSINENEVEEDDFDITKALEEIEEPLTSRGDIWEIGSHRLMCGDSACLEDVKILMNGRMAKHVFTDPPWNVNYGSDTNNPKYKSRKILNDKMTKEDFKKFLSKVFNAMKQVCEDGCMTYVVMSAQEWGSLMNVMREAGYHWSSTVIWKKDSLVLSRKDYHTQYEPIWYGWIAGARLYPLNDRKQSDVWDIPRPRRSDEHPTMKPVELVARTIQNSSKKNDLVLDLFGGSGTTLIASDQLDRTCYMMELDPMYCDVIVRRYIEYADSDAGLFLIRDDGKIPYKDLHSKSKLEAIKDGSH